jgi:hypothetical protein
MHEHVTIVKKNRKWDRPRKSRNIRIDEIAEFWCLYCLECDAPIYATLRRDRVPSPRYSKSVNYICRDPDNHKYAHTYCDMGEPECLSCGQFLGCTNDVVQSYRDDWQAKIDAYMKDRPPSGGNDFANAADYQTALEVWASQAPREKDYSTVYGNGPFVPRYNGFRAHVVAYVLTQDSRPENIVPLCGLCHGVDPSFDDRREYLDWLLDRREAKKANMELFIERAKASKIIGDAKRDSYPDLVTVAIEMLCEGPRSDPLQPFGGRVGITKLERMLLNRRPEIEVRRAGILARLHN